jgi:ubiquinone/menaquinone biosynthesis C-methylase UbiE
MEMTCPELDRSQRDEWDRLYSLPNPTWRGPPSEIPSIPPGSRVLEMGCGDGKTLSSLALGDNEVVATDYSIAAVSRCQARFANHLKLAFAEADSRALPFVDDCFDVVLISHVLGHLLRKGREAAVSEVIRVLAPGGIIFVRVFSREDLRFGKGSEVEEGTFRRSSILTHYFNPEEIESLLHGLQPLSMVLKRTEKRYEGRLMFRAEIEALCQKSQ